MTSKPKILYVSHNHPTIRPGGAEAYAYELYRAVRDGGEFEPLFLARTGPPVSETSRYHEGTLLTGVNEDPGQYFFYTDTLEYDWLFGTPRGKAALIKYLREFLLAQKPDIVHFQHTLFFGYDMLREMRQHARRRRADPLHPARVPADLPPQRTDGADRRREALHGGVPAALPRVLPRRSARRRSSCASDSSSRTCRSSTASWRRATSSGSLRRLGPARREDHLSRRTGVCRSSRPRGAPTAASATGSPSSAS